MNPIDDRKRHPIRVAARRAGLTPDLLRAWELRYDAIAPGRTEGGQRRYSDADVERLRLLRLATDAGRRIGDVVELDPEGLRALVQEDREAVLEARQRLPAAGRASELLADCQRAVVEFDEDRIRSALSRATVMLTPTELVAELASPLMSHVGELWQTGEIDPANEHMVTALVRSTLSEVMSALPPHEPRRQLVVATPAGERHEIGALLVATLAAASGWSVTYLGADLPAASIVRAVLAVDARAVAISLVCPPDPAVAVEEILELRRRLERIIEVFAGGATAVASRDRLEAAGVRVLADIGPFPAALEEIAAGA